jgi:hypothetical protein
MPPVSLNRSLVAALLPHFEAKEKMAKQIMVLFVPFESKRARVG